MIDRDELIKAIAEGRGCGGHYNCFATSEDTAEAGHDLDAYRAVVLREAAALLREYPEYRGTMGVAAGLLEAEAERVAEEQR